MKNPYKQIKQKAKDFDCGCAQRREKIKSAWDSFTSKKSKPKPYGTL